MKKDEFEKEFEQSSPLNMNYNEIANKINYEKYTSENKNNNKMKKAFIYAIPCLVTCLALGIILPIALNKNPQSSNLSRLTTPRTKKIVSPNEKSNKMSKSTYDSYNQFTKNFVSLCFDSSIEENGEISLGISIPDAYLAFAITAVVSNENVQNEFLSYMGLNSMGELKIATKEIVSTMCTLIEDKNGSLSGGYNLNSIWLNPNATILKEKDAQLYSDLEEIFDASIYNEALTSKIANEYLKKNGLKGQPTPKIELNDDDLPATANMSVFYCLDEFTVLRDIYKAQYNSKNHKMDYSFNGNKKSVDYIETQQVGHVYEGTNFTGATSNINRLNMSYYLPDEGIEPSTILSDVLSKNYTYKERIDELNNVDTNFIVTINQPYFKLNNKIDLDRSVLSPIFPSSSSQGGVNEKMVSGIDGNIILSDIIQQSIMTFDYNGFYSCSVTIIEGIDESCPWGENYTLNLNHPYLFSVNQKDINVDGYYYNIPMVVGEIIDPNYE